VSRPKRLRGPLTLPRETTVDGDGQGRNLFLKFVESPSLASVFRRDLPAKPWHSTASGREPSPRTYAIRGFATIHTPLYLSNFYCNPSKVGGSPLRLAITENKHQYIGL